MYQHLKHTIHPVYDAHSKLLILGSFPSVKSRESAFFYGHPQNRFWQVISSVCGVALPETVEAKKKLLLQHHIALWDVIDECDIIGSSDSSIKNVIPNDISTILSSSEVTRVFVNGKTAERLYRQYIEPTTQIKAVYLPSTSPANATWKLEKLIDKWRESLSQ